MDVPVIPLILLIPIFCISGISEASSSIPRAIVLAPVLKISAGKEIKLPTGSFLRPLTTSGTLL